MKENKTKWIVIAAIVVVAIWMFSGYNGLVSGDESVSEKWANVETQYQRRSDLIPNLVNTVKGYASYESETLQKVVEARAAATGITLDADDLTEENMARFQKAQDQLSASLGRLLAISENYPDLKASEQYEALMVELEGCENRIANARSEYNEAVKSYNVSVRRFPTNILASLFNFDKKAMFQASAGAEQAPTVEF